MTKLTKRLAFAWVGLGLSMSTGCQTWVPEAGLTLPSQDYLKHPPQYIPPSPPFPLQRELEGLEEAQRKQQELQGPGPAVFPQ